METILISKGQCEVNDKHQIVYKGIPIFSFSSSPKETEELAKNDLEEVLHGAREKSDGKFKYSLGGVKIWDDTPITTFHIDGPPTFSLMVPEYMFVAYELCGFSGTEEVYG